MTALPRAPAAPRAGRGRRDPRRGARFTGRCAGRCSRRERAERQTAAVRQSSSSKVKSFFSPSTTFADSSEILAFPYFSGIKAFGGAVATAM